MYGSREEVFIVRNQFVRGCFEQLSTYTSLLYCTATIRWSFERGAVSGDKEEGELISILEFAKVN